MVLGKEKAEISTLPEVKHFFIYVPLATDNQQILQVTIKHFQDKKQPLLRRVNT